MNPGFAHALSLEGMYQHKYGHLSLEEPRFFAKPDPWVGWSDHPLVAIYKMSKVSAAQARDLDQWPSEKCR